MGYCVNRELHVSCDACGIDENVPMGDETEEEAFAIFIQENAGGWQQPTKEDRQRDVFAQYETGSVLCRKCYDELKETPDA